MRYFIFSLTILFFLTACKDDDISPPLNPCENITIKGVPEVVWQTNIAGEGDDYIFSMNPIKYGDNFLVTKYEGGVFFLLLINGNTGEVVWEKQLENPTSINNPVYLANDKIYWNTSSEIIEFDLITQVETALVDDYSRVGKRSWMDYPNYIFTHLTGIFEEEEKQYLKVLNVETGEIREIYMTNPMVNMASSYEFSYFFQPIFWKADDGKSLVSFVELHTNKLVTVDFLTDEILFSNSYSFGKIYQIAFYSPDNLVVSSSGQTLSINGLSGTVNYEIIVSYAPLQSEVINNIVGDKLLNLAYRSVRFINTQTGEIANSFYVLDVSFSLNRGILIPNTSDIILILNKEVVIIDFLTGCVKRTFKSELLDEGLIDDKVIYYDTNAQQLLIGVGPNMLKLDLLS